MASRPPTQKLLDSRSSSKNTHFLHSMIILSLWRPRYKRYQILPADLLISNFTQSTMSKCEAFTWVLGAQSCFKTDSMPPRYQELQLSDFHLHCQQHLLWTLFIWFIHCAPGDRVEHDSTSNLSVRDLLSRFRSCASLFNFCQAAEAQDWPYFIRCRDALTLTR
jgi:hypothetical protein